MATKKILYLEQLFEREIADLVRDEDLLSEAFDLFRKASSNPVLGEIFERLRRDTATLSEKLGAFSDKTKETRQDAVRGIIEEGQRRVADVADQHLADAVLISTALRLLGYQTAGYRSVMSFAQLLQMSDAVEVCQEAVAMKLEAALNLQSTAQHQIHWRAAWWAPEHTSAWHKVKQVFKEDWQKTKEHLGVSGESQEDLEDAFEDEEPAFRYGFGASSYYTEREWSEDTAALLRSEYGGLWDDQTKDKIHAGWHYARKSKS